MADDLNSYEALSSLNSLSGAPLASALKLLGIQFSKAETSIEEAEIDRLIDLRLNCFAEKNFTEADRIRDELSAQGIQLKDAKDSETGERITTWEVKR